MAQSTTKSTFYGSRERTPSSPEACGEHYLFLLELFVRQASGDRLAKLNRMFCVPTCVHFGFLDFVDEDDLTVTPMDLLFQPQTGVANDVEIFNAGKSVLFAVDHATVTDRTVKLILKITARKQMPDSIKPDILVGVGELDLSGQYAALRLEMLQYWRKGVPTSKVFDGQVPLIHNESLSASLDIFVRLSGFGQTILTGFDAPIERDPSTFVFDSGELDQVLSYRCRRMDSRDLFEAPSEELPGPTACPVCVPEKYTCVPCGKLAAPLNIYQESPTEACACIDNGPQVFKKGKSCLFALPNVVLQKPLCSFPVTMSVYKELPPGVLPDVMLIGTHQIQIRDLMNTLLSQRVFNYGGGCKILKDTFRIATATGQCVGKVTVYIRASCFGRKIVTQFQIPRDKKSYLFKGADDSPVFQCKRITSATEDRERLKCVCSPKKIGDGSGEATRVYCPDERRRKELKDRTSREIVRKCGCVIKEQDRNCVRTNVGRLR